MGTQKNRLGETILLSTHNIGFGGQIRILEHAKRMQNAPMGIKINLPVHRCCLIEMHKYNQKKNILLVTNYQSRADLDYTVRGGV